MPSTYLESTYAAASLWLENSTVTYRPNPKSGKSLIRYAKYEKAKTVGDALRLGSLSQDLLFDHQHGHLVVSSPLRKKPLDLFQVTNFEQLTYTDKILGRYTCRFDPKRKAQSEIIQETLKEGLRRSQMAQRRMKKLEVASTFKVENVDDLRDSKGFWESGETMARRSVAQKEAQDILAVVRGEGRKVSDMEVLRVLRLWGFRQNVTRMNVMQKGQTWIYSDTLGITADRTGLVLLKEEAKLYPDVCRLLCRWLEDRLPEGMAPKFMWTSINVNKNYAGRIHRDGQNVGPSFLKAFGSFKGGSLNYFGEDNRSMRVEQLDPMTPELAVKLDVSKGMVLFDGNRAHSVDDFQGERYSLVFFTCPRFWRLAPDAQKWLVKCGFRFPTQPGMLRLKGSLRDPVGYAAQGEVGSKTGRNVAAKRAAATAKKTDAGAKKAVIGGDSFRFLRHDLSEHKKLEGKAAKYWAKRPARSVAAEAPKDAPKGQNVSHTWGIARGVSDEEWKPSAHKALSSEQHASHKKFHYSDYSNMNDAVTALNGDKKGLLKDRPRPISQAILRAGYCTIFSKKGDQFYLLWRRGCREEALEAFGQANGKRGRCPKTEVGGKQKRLKR